MYKARLSFLVNYFVKQVLFCSLSSALKSLQSPVLIICAMGSLKVASKNLSTIKKTYPAYCDMKSELDTAWTFVMSWCTTNRNLPAFSKYPFSNNSPQNEDALNWDLYRLSLTRMTYLMEMFSHWRATCSYPLKGIDFRDYLRGNFNDFDISFVGTGVCKKVEYVNIRGHVGTDVTARFLQKLNAY